MERRPVLAFLIKVVPVFFGLLWLWHTVGVSAVYHRLLAGFLDAVYPSLDPAGVVHGVSARGHEIMLRLLVGQTKTGLALNGEDITSDVAMLAALYLSSPIVPRWRLFLACFCGALTVLFLMHAATAWSLSQYAFSGHPDIAPLAGQSARWTGFLAGYNLFFETMGMYLYPLVLWIPYILIVLRGERQTADPR